MSTVVAGHWKLQWPTEKIIEADPLTTADVTEELSVDHSTVIPHLKRSGKVKRLCKWVPYELTENEKKLLFWNAIFSYSRQHTISRLDCNMWWKVDLYDNQQRPAQWVDWEEAPKHFSKPNLHQKRVMVKLKKKKKGHGHCLVVCCPSDPLQLSESRRNHYIWEVCSANWWEALKTATSARSTGQLEEPNSPRHPTTRCTTSTSKAERIGLPSFVSSTICT